MNTHTHTHTYIYIMYTYKYIYIYSDCGTSLLRWASELNPEVTVLPGLTCYYFLLWEIICVRARVEISEVTVN